MKAHIFLSESLKSFFSNHNQIFLKQPKSNLFLSDSNSNLSLPTTVNPFFSNQSQAFLYPPKLNLSLSIINVRVGAAQTGQSMTSKGQTKTPIISGIADAGVEQRGRQIRNAKRKEKVMFHELKISIQRFTSAPHSHISQTTKKGAVMMNPTLNICRCQLYIHPSIH